MKICSPLILFVIILVTIVFIFVYRSGGKDNFAIESNAIAGLPKNELYSTDFQWYPGLSGTYSSDRLSYCLQAHSSFLGFKNCMIYLE